MLNVCSTIIVHLTDSVKCTHKREIIKKNAVTVTHNAQEYMELGVTPVFESRDGTSGTTCLLVKCFCDISCIRLKFSREFVFLQLIRAVVQLIRAAVQLIRAKIQLISGTNVVSLLSVLTVSEQTANALYIGVLSV